MKTSQTVRGTYCDAGHARPLRAPSLMCAGLVLLSTGCTTARRTELQQVAKDWSETIRASQIIPVYPLTEDLQPGDIFLVSVPVDRQQELYDAKGYLPLDNHIARLNPTGYDVFYRHSFPDGTQELPHEWIRPGKTNSWEPAPHAAFPTYSFSVRRGAGLSAALPVQGVPVGLSLLGSEAAQGTIAIRQAATMGLDTLSLYRQLQGWAAANADFLEPFAPSADGKKRNYLRMVSRIYAAGEMDVSLANADSVSAGADVGVPKPVNLLYTELPASTNAGAATLNNYSNNLSNLNQILAAFQSAAAAAGKALPGGSLRVTSASSRAISLHETFDYPLVIGYLAFDCAVLRGGVLGPPIPTHSLLDKSFLVTDRFGDTPGGRVYAGVIDAAIYKLIAEKAGSDAEAQSVQQRLDALDRFIPPVWVRYEFNPDSKLLSERPSLARAGNTVAPGYDGYRRYAGERKSNLTALEGALALPGFSLQQIDDSGTPRPAVNVTSNSPERQRLETLRQALSPAGVTPEENRASRDATAAATSYFIRLLTQ